MKLGFLQILILFYTTAWSQSKSDDVQNPICITIGTSASLFAKTGITSISKDIFRAQNLPPINLMLDWKSSTKFTFGIALHYENFNYYRSLTTNNGIGLSNSNKLYTYGQFSEFAFKTTHINAGIRFLYHIRKNNNDIYTGTRLSYNYFSNYNMIRVSQQKLINAQVVIGIRKQVGKVGFNVEGGFGTPYWCMTGINYIIED